jgi:putative ABC transport system permease protein
VTPLGDSPVGPLRLGLLALFGAVSIILLIACANVANLMLARGAMRQKEMAIRAALGAGRRRLVRQMLTESLLLSICGGVAGLLLALLGVKALVPLIPDDLAHLKDSGIDAAALGFTFLVSLLTGVVAGLIPALQTSQIDLNESLKEGAGSAAFAIRVRARRVSPALVIGELALTLALLAGAGLLIKSFLRLRAVEPGYNPENVLTVTIPLYSASYQPTQQKVFARDLLTRINSLSGVKVAAIGALPLRVGDRPNEVSRDVCCYNVSVDYFRALGLQLRAGRGFTEQDHENAPAVMVINETHARRHFAGEDPIGKRINYGDYYDRQREGTIVGVVADVKRFGLESGVQDSEVYHSVLQDVVFSDGVGNIHLLIRTAGDPLKLAPAVREQVWAINPNLPVVDVMTMEQRLAEAVAPRRFQMLLFGAFAVVALVLAAVGVYGVIAYSVSRRTHEIGIRMALGAAPRDVLLMVVRQGMSLALIGVALGLAAALALARLMENLLFNVKATDPATFAGISLLLISVAALAAYLPARRATKVDPLLALRHE